MKLLATSYLVAIVVACAAVPHAFAAPGHDAQVTRFFHNHPRLAKTPAGQLALLQIKVRQLDARLRSLQAARSAQPAHLSLWLCIHNGEGAWTSNTGNGYYGGLQMTSGWYGGRYHQANWDPPSVQMQAAERGYAASGYSLSWLRGQWPNTSRRCI